MESSICENETESCESIEQIWIKFFSIYVCCTSFQSLRLLFCVCLRFLSLVSSSCPFHLTNSVHLPKLRLPSTCLKSSGQPAFFCQVPLLWNNLPYSLRHSSSVASFKSALKTHLFSSWLWMPCLCHLCAIGFVCVGKLLNEAVYLFVFKYIF